MEYGLHCYWWRMILDEAQMVGSGMSQVRYAGGAMIMPFAVLNIARIQGRPRHSAAAPPHSTHSQVSSLLPLPPPPTHTALRRCHSPPSRLAGTPPRCCTPTPRPLTGRCDGQPALYDSPLVCDRDAHRGGAAGGHRGTAPHARVGQAARGNQCHTCRGRLLCFHHAILRHSGLYVLQCPWLPEAGFLTFLWYQAAKY